MQKWLLIVIVASSFGGAVFSQQPVPPRKKPVLIRDDRTEPEPEIEILDPAMAREHVEVGDFYLKRGNLVAAVDRFRDAVKHDPRWPVGYDKLSKALAKMALFEEAAEVCESFVETNPKSSKIGDFKKKAQRFRGQLG